MLRKWEDVSKTDEEAYFSCGHCGCELVGDDVKEVIYSATYANGDFGICPVCKGESSVNFGERI